MAVDLWICPDCSYFLQGGTCNCWPVVSYSNEQSCVGVTQCEYYTPRVTVWYGVFDARACGGQGIDNAIALCVASSLDEARFLAEGMGTSACYCLTCELDEVIKQEWVEDFEME